MSDPTPFRPFDTLLDEGAALAILRAATDGAEDGELFLERRRSEVLVFDDGRVKTASYDASEGFGLRAVKGEVAGYAHSTEISEAALRRAAQTARLAVGDGGGTMAEPPMGTNARLYTDADPMSGAEFGVKLQTLAEIDAFARALDPRVVQVSASMAASHQEVEILRPEGGRVRDVRPMVRLNVSIIVEENGRRESGSAGGGGRVGIAGLMGRAHWEGVAREALRIAVVNLSAVPAPAGAMDVALGPGWPGILLHEAVGHGLEGDFNRKKQSAFAGLMGQRVAAPGVTVLDDGTIPDRRGSISVDDEGTPSGRNVLIEDGILVGYMQDRQSARLMGVAPTGNGRRESHAHAPMARMTNTYMLGGAAEPGDIVAEVQDAARPNGVLLIPSFAVERTQELLVDLVSAMDEGAIPRAPIFIDSPLATRASAVFGRHAQSMPEGAALVRALGAPMVRFTAGVEESKAIARIGSFHIILAGSGMCDAGRIRHHLKARLWRDDTTVLLPGFQAQGTLGRILADGATRVRIMGEEVRVRARIRTLDVYSGHADADGLAAWLAARAPIRKGLFLVHGEEAALAALAERARTLLPSTPVHVPALDEDFVLTQEGAVTRTEAPAPRVPRERLGRLDWHNDLARLTLDISAAMEARADERSRAALVRRLRRALEQDPGS